MQFYIFPSFWNCCGIMLPLVQYRFLLQAAENLLFHFVKIWESFVVILEMTTKAAAAVVVATSAATNNHLAA